MVDSGNTTVERAISIQSFRTPATRMVTAPVLPITKKIEKFNANAQIALEKKIQKFMVQLHANILNVYELYLYEQLKMNHLMINVL